MKKIILKKGREESLIRNHPWIFSGAVAQADENINSGETVEILSSKNLWIAKGFYSPESQIRVRLWTMKDSENIDANFISSRISAAITSREKLKINSNGIRLINSESDGLPGLVVDKYNDIISVQIHSAGIERWKEIILETLIKILNPRIVYDKSDNEIRMKEGLPETTRILYGNSDDFKTVIEENGIKFLIDVENGHKTGYYLDQRENRLMLENLCEEKEVLNCFSYTGGFGLFACRGGANKITNVDVSEDALQLASQNVSLNNFNDEKFEYLPQDVFKFLRNCRDSRKDFDIIIMDPPKFAASYSQIEKALRGYKDINLLAMKLLRPGGTLMTFSCSGHITQDLFTKAIFAAAVDSGKTVKVEKKLTQAADHSYDICFPEGEYLKGLLCKVY